MGWVKDALEGLNKHGICEVRPQGGSMRGRIESGQLVTIQSIKAEEVQLEDAVFIKWKNNYLLHLVKGKNDHQVLIGNNVGKINGWISYEDVLGKVIKVEE